MLVVMQEGATEKQIEAVIDRLVALGFTVHKSTGAVHTVLGGVGPIGQFEPADFEVLDGVKEAHRIMSPYKLASRSFRPAGTIVKVGQVEIGGPAVVVMAGPCSVESRDQILAVAESVARAGAVILRGGGFKPRSSPYSFQGMGEEGLSLLREAADRNGLLVVTEVMDQTQIPLVAEYSDIVQVGARNMQNFNLLRELGRQTKPVLLKRGTPPPSRSCCFPPNTSWPPAIPTSCCASAAYAPSRATPATRSTSRPSRWCRSSRTCPSSSTRRTEPDGATRCCRWPEPRSPPAPTDCSSRSTTIPTAR